MAAPFSNPDLRVPCGFGNLLEGLAREVLRKQPSDIPAFAAQYFTELLQKREESGFDPTKCGAGPEDRLHTNYAFKESVRPGNSSSVTERRCAGNKNKLDQAEASEHHEDEITQPLSFNEYQNKQVDGSGETGPHTTPEISSRGTAGTDTCAEEPKETENVEEQTLEREEEAGSHEDNETGLYSTSLRSYHLADVDVCSQELQPAQEEKQIEASRDMTDASFPRVSENPKQILVDEKFQGVLETQNDLIFSAAASSAHIKQDTGEELSDSSPTDFTAKPEQEEENEDLSKGAAESSSFFEEAELENSLIELNVTKAAKSVGVPDQVRSFGETPKAEEALEDETQQPKEILPTDEIINESLSSLEKFSLEDSRNQAILKTRSLASEAGKEDFSDERMISVDQNPEGVEYRMQDEQNCDKQPEHQDGFVSSFDATGQSIRPDSPVEPSRPDSSVEPSRPDSPVEPSRPDSPVEPSRPDSPVEPSRPDSSVEPSRPDSPVEPSRPDSPVEPSRPDSPVEPSRPDSPVEPSRPDSSVEPSRPDSPMEPSRPDSPVEPSRPDSPVEPSRPDSPVEPSRSDSPMEPSRPDSPVEPSRPDSPVEPSRPDSPVEPSRPDSPVEPSRPDSPVEPSRPDSPVEPSRPDSPVEPSRPDSPVEPSRPDSPNEESRYGTSMEERRPDSPIGESRPDTPEEPSMSDAPGEQITLQKEEVEELVDTHLRSSIAEEKQDHVKISEVEDIIEENNDLDEAVKSEDDMFHNTTTHESERTSRGPERTEEVIHKQFPADSQEHTEEGEKDVGDRGDINQEPVNESSSKKPEQEESSQPQEEEDIMDIPLDDPEANKAAAKIQAGFRGHMTRKKMKPGEKPGEEVSSSGETLNGSQGDAAGGSEGVETDETSVPEQ